MRECNALNPSEEKRKKDGGIKNEDEHNWHRVGGAFFGGDVCHAVVRRDVVNPAGGFRPVLNRLFGGGVDLRRRAVV